MTRPVRAVLLAAALASVPLMPADGQAGPGGVAAGVEFRRYHIGEGDQRATVRQVSTPIGAVFSRGRFTVDLGTAWVQSTLGAPGRDERSVSSLTDTQLRGSLTLGRDLAVLTLLLNLPTGLDRAPVEDFAVLGAVSSSFLAFPVTAHGNGFSATSGVAFAVPAGDWNLGAAASVRVSSRFTPYQDPAGSLTYKPGLESRIRVGVDRLIGRSKLTAGLTYSTFGTDEFGTGTATIGLYRPGGRWIAEGSVTAPVGRRALLTFFGWHFRRMEGDSAGADVPNDEQLTAAGASLRIGAGRRVRLDLGADGRWTRQDAGVTGWLGGARAELGVDLGGGLTFGPGVRIETGSIEKGGLSRPIRGIGGSVFVRTSF